MLARPPKVRDGYVSLKDVGKTYASARGPVNALVDINLDIRPHEFVSVVGPSGCGKSTLLKLVAGLEDISSGSLLVGGEPLRGPPDGLGVVFQRDVLLDWRTILDNVLLSIELVRKPRKEERERAMRRRVLGGDRIGGQQRDGGECSNEHSHLQTPSPLRG